MLPNDHLSLDSGPLEVDSGVDLPDGLTEKRRKKGPQSPSISGSLPRK